MQIRTLHHERFQFVFGSNLAGRHGKGGARAAQRFYGAGEGCGRGPTGSAYALPTKTKDLEIRALEQVRADIDHFLEHAHQRPDHTFMLTRIGCGLAGFDDEQIAPAFAQAPDNVWIPRLWQRILGINQTTFRVIVAGSRDFHDAHLIFTKLDSLLKRRGTQRIEIISGACPEGVDAIGEHYAEAADLDLTRWPAGWESFGNPAGPLRNAAMAWYADALALFRRGQSRGSTNMLEMAQREQLMVRQG